MVIPAPVQPEQKKLVKKAIDSDRAALTPRIPLDASHKIKRDKSHPKVNRKMKRPHYILRCR